MTGGGLLEKACEGVRTLDLPACIKDSQLRYVCVNAAYAQFAERPLADFRNKTTHELFGITDDMEREDKERRSLVFATEEVILLKGQRSNEAQAMKCERFETEDGALFLFELFEAMPSLVGQPLADRNETLIGKSVLDLLDVAIAVYSAEDRLIYSNARLESLYRELNLDWQSGLELKTIGKAFHDLYIKVRDLDALSPADRDAWVEGKMAETRKPHSEFTEEMCSGRFIRFINKRLENGMLIVLHIDVSDARTQEILLEKHTRENWLFREALERVPVAVFMLDSERRLTYANASYETLWGEPRDKYYGLTESDIFVHEGERFRQENDHVLQTGEELQKTEEIVLNDGTSVPTIIRVGRMISPDNEPYLVGSVTDTTPLMQQKQELLVARNDAERLHAEVQSILRSLPVGVMVLGPDLTIEYANTTFYDLWEVEEQIDLTGQPYRRYFEMGYASGKYDFGDTSLEDAYHDRVERLSLVDDYTSREIESKSGKFTILSKQRIAGNKILITFSDSTAVRARDKEISAARQELQRVGEYMQDATRVMAQGLALIQNGEIIMSNDAMSRMFDVPPDLLAKGQSWLPFFAYCAARGDFGDEETAAATRAQWMDNVAAARPFSLLTQVESKRWLNVEATIGAGGYWLVIVTDVTDMKQREAELEGLLARAKAADRAKSEFLANMSHEIRTPMNGVLGMAELLAKSKLDTRQRTFTDVIVKSGNALLTIINDILDFSKIDAGQMTLRSTSFDAVEAVEDVASLLSSQALEKNIELIVRIDASFKHLVSGDAGRFRQIATNLIANAIKFTETGHVLIELAADSVDDSELIMSLRVTDTGIGIAQHQLNRIFEKFSQADTSSTRRHEGTGLGLAITVGLAGLFGGKVDVESTVGQGSTFTVTLPLRIVGNRSEQAVGLIDTKKVSVLVIDDNEVNRQILTEQLTGWGVDSYAADSGPAGLAILKEAAAIGFDIDAVILDYHMPDMDGMQVASAIKSDPRLADTVMIFLTSMDAVNHDKPEPEIQFDAHLMKPVRARLLRKTLTDVVRTSRAKRAFQDQIDVVAVPEFQNRAKKSAEPSHRATAEASAFRSEAQISEVRSTSGSLDVLIAEDNDVNQIVFTQILQQTDLDFRIVNNGKKAVEAWRNDRPSIILMDVSMPVMNGHQATQAIRAEEQKTPNARRVPIIGVTAYAQDSDRDLCLAVGMDDYLSKPISPELLQAKIDKWLMRPSHMASESKSN
ncbi:response regulator [Agrobacterium rosae]|uniref:Sensory/regulatory protein RpfC n=1 Tax=Agrobacterium rosae TaxID=1972867 RepID=A0AAE5S122_9HYPH|nr:response regulator [Agrobacterium rosae]KAA3513241.1 response regulator [Agrobacterium rosae]KAA3521275.1 response regulator [Agrobacterium rosae]MDX8328036.1 response regulator [Agrobacterium rosae]MQB48148.1 response regulator [Agrobacterium rosae]POO53566.1 hybrid sensor histidine kinase/response regulator [Agrobacterium rosae]